MVKWGGGVCSSVRAEVWGLTAVAGAPASGGARAPVADSTPALILRVSRGWDPSADHTLENGIASKQTHGNLTRTKCTGRLGGYLLIEWNEEGRVQPPEM
jgi:hypothetical protein